MKKIIYLIFPIALGFACGNKQAAEEAEVVNLETFKDKLSYSMGALNAKSFTENGDSDLNKLDFDLMAKGFESNLNDTDPSECRDVLKKLFGESFANFDSTYVKEGSECLGRLAAADFYKQMTQIGQLDKFDLKLLATGFRHGLKGGDTLIAEADQRQIVQDFVTDVSKIEQEKMAALDAPFMEEAKTRANTNVLESGIVIETLKAGTGGSPTMYDDVEANYILTNAQGDTLESSKVPGGQPLKINLQSVIPGWTMSFPQMKKGGVYRLFLPSDMAYKQGALCFYVEFLDFGKAGTLAPPPQPRPY